MIDHYNNLTLKTLFTLKYFLNTSNFETRNEDGNKTYSAVAPQYLVKIDDDSYLNLPLLWRSLEQNNISQLPMGMKFSKPVPWQVPQGKKNRKPKKWADKWACPKYVSFKFQIPCFISLNCVLDVQWETLPTHVEWLWLRNESVHRRLFVQTGPSATLLPLRGTTGLFSKSGPDTDK